MNTNSYIMGKSERYNKVLSLVAEETEVRKEMIVSSNKQEEVVDARSLLIRILYEQGFYPIQISQLSGICPRCVSPFIVGFNERKENHKMLGINYENIKRKLGELEEKGLI